MMGGRACADGKFYGEKIPPDIPYQRAFMLFHEESETLVLQSKYEFSQTTDTSSIGWVVPVPSVPEIASVDADAAFFFFVKTFVVTRPKMFRISGYVIPIAILLFWGSVAFVLFVLIQYPFLNKIGLSKSAWWNRLRNGLITTAIAFLLLGISTPHLGIVRDVDVIKAEKAGVYDVKVIRGRSADGIMGWLEENGFGSDGGDIQVFEDYVNRNWCFVAARVEPEPGTEEHKIVTGKMVAPLILRFKTDQAIYPLVLTSTIGAETEVLLYTLSERKLTCGERLPLRCATKTMQWKFSELVGREETEAASLFSNVPDPAVLCKFKKRLKPEEMKEDIVFDFASDNESYRETKVVW
jgi:hypothetical protein